ncbi:MAG TPA: ATP-binding protein [Bacteroidales bacterium]|nr:ATP-binding protein [Bacteroidales bacterium]HNQ82809.1 ATP-binding protein [Bacteroidales bacterium]HOX77634.1 ATP-binding protein [Bacteroidales bacterium]HPI84737.1 ATP-binding protein [Bacteroidales bacterium]HPM91229.1 ATP-binding protein [Bacteroidales bacterium]
MNRPKEFTIGSTLEEMYRIEQFVDEISDEYLLYGSYFGNILMALTEAVRNAVVHGNGNDSRKRVYIRQEKVKAGLMLTVSDEGQGFDFKTALESAANLKAPETSGNGLFLMQKLSDEINFRNEGRTVEMLFRINGIDESIFNRRAECMNDFFKVYQKVNS